MSGDRKPRERKAGESPASDFIKLLDYLKITRGFDFSGYKLSSLIRRVQKRMQQVSITTYSEYVDFLEVHPDEFHPLFNMVLINVTSFFRDPQSWDVVKEQILPRILESKAEGESVRCWSAGCASGEEAYTLAILLAEALGEPEFRRRVKIYATDADEEALAQARQGSYTAAKVEAVPEELRGKYFDRTGDRCVFRPDLRRSLIFGRHDLVQDAAISRVDLLTCRNTLMYFNAEMQAKVLARFHFALHRDGYLFLGKAETLLSHSNSFRPEDLKARIFQRTPTSSLRDRLLAITPASATGDFGGVSRPVRVREAAFDAGPVAQIAVDRKGHLILANDKARRLFNFAPGDLGRLLQDLEISYRPVELRSHIDAACTSRLPVTLKNAEWRPVGGEPRVLEVCVTPLLDGGGTLLGAGISFLDHTVQTQLHTELERANQELETAYEELQSSNEELETTNEELQSTVEELETTNEELQSTNEELETMNEELQSTNEELGSINEELRHRGTQLNDLNRFLRSVFASLGGGVAVVDQQLRVKVWNHRAEDLWGVRSEEAVDQRFGDLDIGLPVDKVKPLIADTFKRNGESAHVTLPATNRRGRQIQVRITATPLIEPDQKTPQGVILLMEEVSE